MRRNAVLALITALALGCGSASRPVAKKPAPAPVGPLPPEPGSVLWARAFGSDPADQKKLADDDFRALVSDDAGNLLLAGKTGFVAKTSPDGVVLWNQKLGDGSINPLAVAHDSHGDVIVAGESSDVRSGGGVSLRSDVVTLAKLDGVTGGVRWQRRFKAERGGDDLRGAVDVAVTGEDIVLTFDIVGEASFEGRPLASEHPTASDDGDDSEAVPGDIFMVAVDGAGNPRWARTIGSTGADAPIAIAVLENADIALLADAPGAIVFGNHIALGTASSASLVLATFAPDGKPRWARRFEATGQLTGGDLVALGPGLVIAGELRGHMRIDGKEAAGQGLLAIAIDAAGRHQWSHVYESPGHSATVTAAAATSTSFAVTGNAPPVDDPTLDLPFVAHIDASGQVLWRLGFTAQTATAYAIAITPKAIVFAGSFSGTLGLGLTPLASHGEQAFLAALVP